MHAAARTLFALLLSVGATSAPLAAYAAEKSPAPKTVEELIDRVEKQLGDLSAYSCDADMIIAVKSAGVKSDLESAYEIRIDKPRRWAIEMTSGMFGGSSVSDGEEVSTYLSITKKYTVEPLPEDWDAARSEPLSTGAPAMMLGPAAFSAYFLGRGFEDEWAKALEATSVEAEPLDGADHWVGRFTVQNAKVELWVPQDGEPLRRVVITPELGAARSEKMSMQIRVDFKDWQTKPKFTDADFAFDPPEDAEESDSLMGGMMEEGPHPLIGEPAPTFEAAVLDGKEFKLADALKSKDKVIMLDFWATWCGPCVDALPEVTAAADELKARGVVFYAVNIQEEADAVREFLAGHELFPPVLLDADGDIAAKYQANAIPQTVLIGKDGRVQVVHVGGSSDLKKVLLADLKKLLAGEDLATETLRKQKTKAEADAEPAPEDDAPAEDAPAEDAAVSEDADAAGEAEPPSKESDR